MKTKTVTAIMTILFLASIVTFAVPAKASPAIIHVPKDYPTIQQAVDAAGPGDIIIVHSGTYEETVIIRPDDHHLSLKGRGCPIMADKSDGSLLYGIDLKGGAHHISISGFEITGFDEFNDAGIAGWTNPWDPDFAPMSYISIHHNSIHDNWDGINIGAFVWATWSPPSWRHNNTLIHHNEIYHNHYRGVNLWSVSESTVAHNKILNNGGDWNANGVFNEIPGDDFNGNGVPDGDGMTWVYVNWTAASYNKIHGSAEVGFSINQCTDNIITHNDVRHNNNLGIALFGWGVPTTRNVFKYNDARGNTSWDILCYLKWGSMVYGNTWIKNKYDDASPIPLV